jgi:hypothetical protein
MRGIIFPLDSVSTPDFSCFHILEEVDSFFLTGPIMLEAPFKSPNLKMPSSCRANLEPLSQ